MSKFSPAASIPTYRHYLEGLLCWFDGELTHASSENLLLSLKTDIRV